MYVNEIFESISGEVGVIPQGSIAWFIRFQGCNCQCAWCDTKGSQVFDVSPHLAMTAKQIAKRIPANSNVVLTGGEPLMQDHDELYQLELLLSDKKCTIQVETNGSQVPFLPVCHVFDFKPPSSGMQSRMMDLCHFVKFCGLGKYSKTIPTWIKFVIKDDADLEVVLQVLQDLDCVNPGWYGLRVALSVESGEKVSQALVQLKKRVPALMHKITFNFQLHKHLNLK